MPDSQKELRKVKTEIKETREEVAQTKQELKETRKELEARTGSAPEMRARRLEIARQVEREVAARVVTIMTTTLAVVAGLFWQTAISDTIKAFIPISGAWQYELAVALIITVGAAVTIYMLGKWTDGFGK
jgi:hypothetical protein